MLFVMYNTPSRTPAINRSRIRLFSFPHSLEGIDLSVLRRAPIKSSHIQEFYEETDEDCAQMMLSFANPHLAEEVFLQ